MWSLTGVPVFPQVEPMQLVADGVNFLGFEKDQGIRIPSLIPRGVCSVYVLWTRKLMLQAPKFSVSIAICYCAHTITKKLSNKMNYLIFGACQNNMYFYPCDASTE